MFFILSKVLFVFLSPFSWLIIALILAFFARSAKWKKRGRIGAIVIALFFSNTFIYKEFCRQWEVFGTPLVKMKHHDVGIVLGGMGDYNNDLQTFSIRRGGDRIWQALNLYKAGKIDKILISGDNGYLVDKGLHEAQQVKEALVKWGIPANDIITETKSRNTYENAVETQKVLARSYPEIECMVLIISGRHMRRAMGCFEGVGLKCTPYSTDLYTGPNRAYNFGEFIEPDVSTMTDWTGLIKEWIGYLAYAVTGKI